MHRLHHFFIRIESASAGFFFFFSKSGITRNRMALGQVSRGMRNNVNIIHFEVLHDDSGSMRPRIVKMKNSEIEHQLHTM